MEELRSVIKGDLLSFYTRRQIEGEWHTPLFSHDITDNMDVEKLRAEAIKSIEQYFDNL